MSIECSLPRDLYRAADVRELDRTAIETLGIPGSTLMERAGLAAYDALRARWPEARSILVVCGGGNNAGDGFVLARHARADGYAVTVAMLGDPDRLKGDARGAFERMRSAGQDTVKFDAGQPAAADVVVDGVFGTGLDRPVEGGWARALEAIGNAGTPVLALDIPSGLHADTGRVQGVAVRACLTVSFIGLKQGMFTGSGPECCGTLAFSDLGVPPETYAAVSPASRRLDLEGVGRPLGPRSRVAHKDAFGHVLVVGGEQGYSGAARLAGEAAARVGAGLVSVATRAAHAPAMNVARPELMCHPVETPEALAPLLERATVVAVGPGLGRTDWSRAMLDAVLVSATPLVVDADGLNLLAGSDLRREDWVLTPHPGEAARLLDTTTQGIAEDRFAAVRGLVGRYGGVCLLKGAGTLVADARGVGVCGHGNPGMASGGTGDVLTGVVAGLLAQGLAPLDAAVVGTCLHGRAGDLAAGEGGERGLLAGDLVARLRGLASAL